MPIKACLFDMDGVLVDSMAHHHTAWKETFMAMGAKLPEEEFRKDVYLCEGEKSDVTLRHFSIKYPLTTSASPEEILHFKHNHFHTLIPFLSVNEGMPELISFLKTKGIKLALVSGSAKVNIDRIVERYYPELFDCVITGSDVAKGKPDPLPYTTAAARLGVEIHECIVIENAPLGTRAGVAAGAKVVGILINSPLQEDALRNVGACQVHKSVSSLRAYLEKELRSIE